MSRMPEGSDAAAAALAKLTDAIRDADQREAFVNDPAGMMEKAGVSAGDIPEPAMEALTQLGPEELRLLSDVNEKFTEAGLHVTAPDGGTVCFF